MRTRGWEDRASAPRTDSDTAGPRAEPGATAGGKPLPADPWEGRSGADSPQALLPGSAETPGPPSVGAVLQAGVLASTAGWTEPAPLPQSSSPEVKTLARARTRGPDPALSVPQGCAVLGSQLAGTLNVVTTLLQAVNEERSVENITSMEMTDSPPAGKPESTFQSKFVHMYMIHQSELGQTHRNCGFSSDASELSRHSETLLGAMFWAGVRKPGSLATAGLSA